MNVPCSGAICSPVSFGYSSAVWLASSRNTASGGLLYALRRRLICSLRRAVG
jgi:hypothetical protein